MWWVDIFGVTEEAVMTVASLVCVGGGETAGIFFSDPLYSNNISSRETRMSLCSSSRETRMSSVSTGSSINPESCEV